MRTCTGCRKRSGKDELLRLVRTPGGSVAWDPSGKSPGRGAYLCADVACFTESIRRGRLSRALRAAIRPEIALLLEEGHPAAKH
ncbi:MAG TPA: YlxR family protein [Actinomycetota bacterium]|nr:YlxR family protein [Actinomycetota bacterium]